MLINTMPKEVPTQCVKVILAVTECESATGIEFDSVCFYTRANLNKEALEEAISHIYGCHDMFDFEYDRGFGQGGFILLCGGVEPGEYEIELPS
ncbi:hypothetical protein [Rahnella sp. ChDrAdgB13]|uniref:hypothetical protein n=1 Tax=Rahnella sp. ChDrAdgB13 TaxID=1850581 RepID=UPI001AD868A4|nr:hypothetical protein [Rahnella sp. ChDrAdgB13]